MICAAGLRSRTHCLPLKLRTERKLTALRSAVEIPAIRTGFGDECPTISHAAGDRHLTVVYFIAGKLALKVAFLHASASPVWPPAGIALAALLVLGYRTWPAIFLGAFLVNLTTAGNIATSLCIGTGNALEALCGAWLVNRFAGGVTAFDRAGNVFKFALAVVISTLISPSFGLTSLALGGFADWANYGAIWLTWWLGDVTGDLVMAPLVVLWCAGPSRRRNRERNALR